MPSNPDDKSIRTRHDQLFKLGNKLYFKKFGHDVQPEHEIISGVLRADVYFAAEPPLSPESREKLGLLGTLASQSCILEGFSKTPQLTPVKDSFTKALILWQNERREKKNDDLTEPYLWICSPGQPLTVIEELDLQHHPQIAPGVYLPRASGWKLGVVVISELPETPETLYLRVFGRGQTQRQAADELAALSPGTWPREEILRLFERLKIEVELRGGPLTEEEKEFVMNVEAALEEFERTLREEGKELGRDQGRKQGALLALYEVRFGSPSPELRARVEATTDLEKLQQWLTEVSSKTAEELAAMILAEDGESQSDS